MPNVYTDTELPHLCSMHVARFIEIYLAPSLYKCLNILYAYIYNKIYI